MTVKVGTFVISLKINSSYELKVKKKSFHQPWTISYSLIMNIVNLNLKSFNIFYSLSFLDFFSFLFSFHCLNLLTFFVLCGFSSVSWN